MLYIKYVTINKTSFVALKSLVFGNLENFVLDADVVLQRVDFLLLLQHRHLSLPHLLDEAVQLFLLGSRYFLMLGDNLAIDEDLLFEFLNSVLKVHVLLFL